MKKLNVFIDGSCVNINNKKKAIGGWAYTITDSNFNIIKEDNGRIREGIQDSNRAELEALYQALLKVKTFKGNTKFHIYVDYDTIVDSLNGFADRKANRDYWDKIEPICMKLAGNFMVSHVIGHQEETGDKIIEFNNKTDRHARAGARSLMKVPVNN